MVLKLTSIGRLFACIIAAWGASSTLYAQNLEQDFENLLERCRASIEMGAAFERHGMQQRAVAKPHLRNEGFANNQTGWMGPQSELYVVLTEWTGRDGQTRRRCDVQLSDEDRILSKGEQGLLLRHFVITKKRLSGLGAHEIDTQLTSIPPLINDAFLLSHRNPNGCRVVTRFVVSPDGTYFSAGTAEQAIETCDKN